MICRLKFRLLAPQFFKYERLAGCFHLCVISNAESDTLVPCYVGNTGVLKFLRKYVDFLQISYIASEKIV